MRSPPPATWHMFTVHIIVRLNQLKPLDTKRAGFCADILMLAASMQTAVLWIRIQALIRI